MAWRHALCASRELHTRWYGRKVRTVVFERQGGKWLVVHEHISVPLK